MDGDWVKWLVLALVASAACTKHDEPASDVSATAIDSAPRPPDGRALVVANCLACHGVEMLEQQRLTAAQWAKVVNKMVAWGASVESANQPILTEYLASTYGIDTAPYAASTIDPSAAAAAIAVHDDGQFVGGDADRGRAVFKAWCASCHGADGHGGFGVNLVDRSFLWDAAAFAAIVHDGRGKMPPSPVLADAQIADLLAHLRRMR